MKFFLMTADPQMFVLESQAQPAPYHENMTDCSRASFLHKRRLLAPFSPKAWVRIRADSCPRAFGEVAP